MTRDISFSFGRTRDYLGGTDHNSSGSAENMEYMGWDLNWDQFG